MLKSHIYLRVSVIAAMVIPMLTSCLKDDLRPVGGGDSVSVVFTPDFDSSLDTKAISDGVGADEFLVAVYEASSPVEISRTVGSLDEALTDGVELRLLSGHDYKLLFWAYDSDNTAYTLSDNGVITADYADYLNGGFAKMEELDAFYALSSVSVSEGSTNESVTLKRPFAQINFADDSTQPVAGTHVSEISFEGLPLSFDVFTGKGVGSGVDKSFTFSDFTGETLSYGGTSYYYVATNYIFVPESGVISATCRLKQDGAVVTEHVLSSIAVAANKRTNVVGAIVGSPEDIWDGSTLTVPSVDDQNRYVIDETSDLAWLAANGLTLESNRTFILAKDLNMGGHALSSAKLPQGSIVDGAGHTIKNILTSDGGLFGDATDLTLKNLTIDGITVGAASSHVGALVNTLKGSGSFSSVTVKNAVVSTTSGAAGGMVGYVVRKSVKERGETLSLTFDDCHADNVSVAGSQSEGLFVGLLSGYDAGETVSFASNCSVARSSVADYSSPYREGNEGAWLKATDYSRYNAWLGDETFSRGVVNYGGVRFVPRWDGVKKVEPLVESGVKVIYSAFDLAYLQGGSHASVTFKSNVDLAGVKSPDPKDDTKGVNRFVSISSITNLDGGNHTIYGLYIHVVNCQYWVGGGFLLGISGATTHKNLTFDGAQIIVTHNDSDDDGGARAATLLPTVENGSYVAENIHARNGYVYGVNKMGGLFGYVAASQFNVSDCSVTSYSIENYNSGKKDSFGFLANGEVGGMIGFLQANSEIKNCDVFDTAFNCFGVNNGVVAGRHVNGFIGDIRTPSAQVIKLSNCVASGNTFSNRAEDKYTYRSGLSKITVDIVGCCYYVNSGVGFTDECGKLYVNGVERKVAWNGLF